MRKGSLVVYHLETQQGQDLASCRRVNTDTVGSGYSGQLSRVWTVGPGGTEYIVQSITFSIKKGLCTR